MRFKSLQCPYCHELARGTVDTLIAVAELTHNEDGTSDYAGESDVDWNSQTTRTSPTGRQRLICSCGHEWYSKVEYV